MQRRMISVVIFFVFLRIFIFCFVAVICDLVHDVETTFHLPYVLTSSENLSNDGETAKCSFTGITNNSEKISRCC